ncbi:MAG TPA: amino acid permease, partial [Flavisolibacter sp.]|nr:amino acid permease [Flavisolibacter sp.]
MQEDVLTPVEALKEDKSFKRSLGLTDATMIVAGSMIGSGIFIVSADMLKDLGSAGWLIAAWLITGFMTLTAALSYGELSAMFPKAGGQYVYLREAYNPFIGFLYGWSFFAVIQTGTIAAVAVAFGKFLGYLAPSLGDGNILLGSASGFKITAAQMVGIFLILLLTYINTKGIKSGKLIQTTFTSAKLLALFGLIIFGFVAAKGIVWNQNWQNAWEIKQHISRIDPNSTAHSWTPLLGVAALGAIASAMVGSIFSSDAWNNVTFIAGEVKNPQRNIGLSLFLGTLIVTVIYVSTNLMYLSVLPIEQLAFAKDNRIALSVSLEIFGAVGATILALLIMVSTFGCNNGLI